MDNTEGELWGPGSLLSSPSPSYEWLLRSSHQLLLFPLPVGPHSCSSLRQISSGTPNALT